MDPELEELAATDVFSSLAFRAISELQSDGKVDADKAQQWKKKYEDLHSALVVILSNDRGLLQRASDMSKLLQDELLQLEKLMVRSHQEDNELEMLREDMEQAESEGALAREKEQMLVLEDAELTRQKEERRKKIEDIEKEHQAALIPQIRAHKDEIEELQARIAEGHQKHEATKKELEETRGRLDKMGQECAELQGVKGRERARLAELEGVPEKIKKQAETEGMAMKRLRVQEAKLLDKMREQEIESTKLYDKVRRLTEQFTEASAALERIHMQADQKDRLAADVRKDLEMARLEAEQTLADQVQLQQRVQAMVAEAKREGDEHARGTKEKDAVLRKYKKAEQDIKVAQGNLPGLSMAREQVQRDLGQAEAEHKSHVAAMEELKMEMDAHMSAYLKQENVGKEKAAVVQASFMEVEVLEKEVDEMRAQEKYLRMQASDLASQRERSSRLLSVKLSKLREAEEEVKMKNLIVDDLKQSERDGQKALAEALKLYDLVRSQRSRFVTLTQAAAQGIAEMREKLTILGAEIDILKRSITEKERALGDARSKHAASLAERDGLRQQLQELGADFRVKQVTVDEQIAQIDNLSNIINSAEREMLRLRKAYENAIEARDATGVTLIDRNDEISILYEKSNVLDDIYKAGAIELAGREDEIRMLHLELKEAQYQIEVTRKKCPQVPEMQEQIEELKNEVTAEREKVRNLGDALEMPDRNSRWKELDGSLPERAELETKIGQLEERISEKKEQILEKGLILEEVTSLSDKLRASVTDGKDGALQLAVEVNSYQHKIRGITRKMMATVSELSLYQAGAIKLQEERERLAEHVQVAAQKLEAGEPPDASAEREWMRMEREQRTVEELRIKMDDEKEDEPIYVEGGMRQARPLHSTAEVRPNAYIPEDEGIPRPYGGHAPFKPVENGSTMRHIRKPEPKPIQI